MPYSIHLQSKGAPEISPVTKLEMMGCIFALACYSFIFYWLPQIGLPLHSDVTWIYRLQVANPDVIGKIPGNLAALGASPLGWFGACAKDYEAFGRLNCLDIWSFRAIAMIAANSADAWLAIYLLTNIATVTLLYLFIRNLGLPSAISVIFAACALVAPSELWLGYRTSEPRNALVLLLALNLFFYINLNRANIISAALMVMAVLLKEPMIVYWPMVVLFAFSFEIQRANGVKGFSLSRLVFLGLPHIFAFLALLFLFYSEILTLDNKFNYAFMTADSRPSLGLFLSTYWGGLSPALFKGAIIQSIFCVVVIPVFAVIFNFKRRRIFVRELSRPTTIVVTLVGILTIILHGAFYYITGRLVGDDRYANPANLVALIVFSGFLLALFKSSGAIATKIGAVLGLLSIAYSGASGTIALNRDVLIIVLFCSISPLLITFAILRIGKFPEISDLLRIKLNRILLDLCVLISLIIALVPFVNDTLVAGGQIRSDMLSWKDVIDKTTTSPKDAMIEIITPTPFLIETLWGLQTEMILMGRNDIKFSLRIDNPAYLQEGGNPLKEFTDPYIVARGAYDKSKTLLLYMDRDGRTPRVNTVINMTPAAIIWSLTSSPIDYVKKHYFDGVTGFLRSSWNSPLPMK